MVSLRDFLKGGRKESSTAANSKYGKNHKELECNVKMLTVETIANEANATAWMQLLTPLTILVRYLCDVASVK